MEIIEVAEKYKVGTVVRCDFCGRDNTVEAFQIYDGGLGFELSCGHRNGYCEKCDMPVRDLSDLPNVIAPECFTCSKSCPK